VLLFPLSGEAGFYSWKDENGKTHFTDDPSQVPPEYREDGKGLKKHRGLGSVSSPEDESSSYRSSTRNGRRSNRSPSYDSSDFSGAEEFEYEVPLIPTSGGNYLVKTRLNGKVEALLMFDTGASMVTLSQKIGKKLGWRKNYKTPEIPFSTAGGTVWSPLLTLDRVDMSGAEVKEVEASINSSMDEMEGMDGLLGMSYLGQFKVIIDQTNLVMILKPLGDPDDKLWEGKPGYWWKAKFQGYNKQIEEMKKYAGLMARARDINSPKLKKIINYYIKMRRNLEKRAIKAGVPRRYRY
jgi:clan AA aspartic protease (TIGR02281 family)